MLIGKIKVSKKNYQEIVQETQEILKELNQDTLINWEEQK